MFFHGVGADSQFFGYLLICFFLPIAASQDGASRFGQIVGYVFRLLQQCLVCTITLIHFRTGGFGEAVDVLLFHIQMLQTVETPVTHGGIEPSATGVFLQLVELLVPWFRLLCPWLLPYCPSRWWQNGRGVGTSLRTVVRSALLYGFFS